MVIGGSEAKALVARGEYAALMMASFSEGVFVTEGTPLKPCIMSDGMIGSFQAASVVLNAPHPNASLVFANFLLSKEAQTALSSVNEGPARGDVPMPHPEFQDLSNINAPILEVTEELFDNAPEIWKNAKPWFGM